MDAATREEASKHDWTDMKEAAPSNPESGASWQENKGQHHLSYAGGA